MHYLIPLDPNVERRLKPFHKRVLNLVWDIVYSKKTNLVEKNRNHTKSGLTKKIVMKNEKRKNLLKGCQVARTDAEQASNMIISKGQTGDQRYKKILVLNVNKSVYYTLDEP